MSEYQFIGSKTANLPYQPGTVYRAQIIANIDVVLHELAHVGVKVNFDHAEYGVT